MNPALDSRIQTVPRESAGRLSRVMLHLEEAQAEVGRLTRIHAAYLRRSKRTIQVLMNFVSTRAMMYARPVEVEPPRKPS